MRSQMQAAKYAPGHRPTSRVWRRTTRRGPQHGRLLVRRAHSSSDVVLAGLTAAAKDKRFGPRSPAKALPSTKQLLTGWSYGGQ
jgi:hypothetical protein